MCVCMNAHAGVCMYMCICVHMCTCIYAYMYIYIHIYIVHTGECVGAGALFEHEKKCVHS